MSSFPLISQHNKKQNSVEGEGGEREGEIGMEGRVCGQKENQRERERDRERGVFTPLLTPTRLAL